jgi:thiamine biosynthesis lipoprotein
MSQTTIHKRGMHLMGNHFEITVVAADAYWANQRIDMGVKEIKRIEDLLTTYNNESETNQINQYAGVHPVLVSHEMIQIIERSKKISEITQGAFDITYGSVDKSLWNFDTQMTSLPSKKTAKSSVRLINYKNIEVDMMHSTVFLKEKGMRIGFGGIGKGYAAEMAKKVMKKAGVESGVVNASGDLSAWGNMPNGLPWTIGIANPNLSNQIFSYMDITDMSVATSGNYEKFVIIDGKKYSHTIDPKTGLPISGIKSVTIISANAEIADAMATPVMIMGVEAGLHMINQIKHIEAIIISDDDKIFTSKNINIIK